MKTLADLKREVKNYELKLFENSWFKTLPEHQKSWRKVRRVQNEKFTLITNVDGIEKESWIDFPKASEMQLIKIGEDKYTLIITQKSLPPYEDKPDHIMIYELRKI